jgi:hypothetical protein
VTNRAALVVYATGFAAMLGAGAVLAVTALGSMGSVDVLWVSSALSVAAIVASAAAVLLGRR